MQLVRLLFFRARSYAGTQKELAGRGRREFTARVVLAAAAVAVAKKTWRGGGGYDQSRNPVCIRGGGGRGGGVTRGGLYKVYTEDNWKTSRTVNVANDPSEDRARAGLDFLPSSPLLSLPSFYFYFYFFFSFSSRALIKVHRYFPIGSVSAANKN